MCACVRVRVRAHTLLILCVYIRFNRWVIFIVHKPTGAHLNFPFDFTIHFCYSYIQIKGIALHRKNIWESLNERTKKKKNRTKSSTILKSDKNTKNQYREYWINILYLCEWERKLKKSAEKVKKICFSCFIRFFFIGI